MIKNIGILGATSFIGLELIKQLTFQNFNIYIFSRKRNEFTEMKLKNISFIHGKFNKKDLLKFISKVDVIVNLIAEVNDIKKMDEVNIELLKKIISASKKRVKKIIHISSVSVYGENKKNILEESSLCLPIEKYGTTKLVAENLLIKASKQNYFKTIIIRPSNIIGQNMKNQSILHMIDSIKKNIFFYFQNKNSNMNYVYVNDLCKIILKLIKYNKFKKYEIFNFSNKIKLFKFVGLISKKFNKKNNFINLPYKLVIFLSYFYYIFPKFPLKPSRVKALNVKLSYSNKKIAKIIDIKKYNNLENGLLELIKKYNEKKNLFRC